MNRRIILLFAAIIAIIAGFIYYRMSPESNPNYIKTTATIEKINKTYSKHKEVRISYYINDTHYTPTLTISNGIFSPKETSKITIYCNKDKPHEFTANTNPIKTSYALFTIGFIIIAILIIDRFSLLINKLPITRTD